LGCKDPLKKDKSTYKGRKEIDDFKTVPIGFNINGVPYSEEEIQEARMKESIDR